MNILIIVISLIIFFFEMNFVYKFLSITLKTITNNIKKIIIVIYLLFWTNFVSLLNNFATGFI